jgi:hypothetical protein
MKCLDSIHTMVRPVGRNTPIVRLQVFEDKDDDEYGGFHLPQKLHGPRVLLRDRQTLASGLILKQQSEPLS